MRVILTEYKRKEERDKSKVGFFVIATISSYIEIDFGLSGILQKQLALPPQ
jgi:hypothetical protein